MGFTKATSDYLDAGGIIKWITTPKTADFTAVAGEGYFVDTTSAAITVTLPSSPTAGDEVSIIDYGANASTNNITITSSDNIEGAADDLTLSTNKISKTLVYSDATKGWLIANDAGGAGGLRSTVDSSGGGASAESSLSLATATDYTVSVGPGGGGGTSLNGSATNGTGSTFANITSDGGGGGGNHSSGDGAVGGSGGGGCSSGTQHYGAYGTSGQGYAGGNTGPTSPAYGGGGGGGAAAAGANGTSSAGGNGGIGDQISITGTSTYYAGGGGGGCQNSNTPGTGGSGGGANGTGDTSTPSNATPNTGGGGGGSGYTTAFANGGNGGSGVVILKYPDAYTISETTSPSVLTFTTDSSSVSGYKITTFTAGENGTIQFS